MVGTFQGTGDDPPLSSGHPGSSEAGYARHRRPTGDRKLQKQCCTTLKTDPERYLRASFQQKGVNLDLLADIYKQARQLGIIDQPSVDDANGMFEHVRKKLYKRRNFRNWMFGPKVEDELQKLRYLLACLEETGKIDGLKLMIEDVHQKNGSLSDLMIKLRDWREKQTVQTSAGVVPPVFAYAF